MKSVISRNYHTIDEARQAQVETQIFDCCVDKSELIKKAGKLCLVTMVARKGILKSEGILEFIVKCIKYVSNNAVRHTMRSFLML